MSVQVRIEKVRDLPQLAKSLPYYEDEGVRWDVVTVFAAAGAPSIRVATSNVKRRTLVKVCVLTTEGS